jgi:hypothetical protein
MYHEETTNTYKTLVGKPHGMTYLENCVQKGRLK